LRLSRSYGVSVALASQRVEDFSISASTAVINSGLLAVMPSPNPDYWRRVSKYVLLSRDDIKRLTTIISFGEALIRISSSPRPYLIRYIG